MDLNNSQHEIWVKKVVKWQTYTTVNECFKHVTGAKCFWIKKDKSNEKTDIPSHVTSSTGTLVLTQSMELHQDYMGILMSIKDKKRCRQLSEKSKDPLKRLFKFLLILNHMFQPQIHH